MEESVALEERPEKSVSSDLIRGHINTIILRALYDGDKYGYEIISEIERKSHGQYSLKQPSLYSALKRLEKDGYVTSYTHRVGESHLRTEPIRVGIFAHGDRQPDLGQGF